MNGGRGRGLRFAVALIVTGGIILPIMLGLLQTVLPAFGYLPSIGAHAFSLDPWRQMLLQPGFATSFRLTLTAGFASTLLALLLATGFCAAVHGRVGARSAERMLAPLLAAPHAAVAIGIAFVIAPSGWIARIISPGLTGWIVPPDVATVHDSNGIALILGLLVKEVPFFLLVILAALNQIPVGAQLAAGRALGYGRGIAWIKIIMPQVYPQIRLAVYVVLAFALSVVDVAIILGPGNPPTLSVSAMRWFMSPDTDLLLPASAAAVLQTMLVVAGIACWWLAERLVIVLGRWWIRLGGRGLSSEPGLRLASLGVMLLYMFGAAGLCSLVIWSFSQSWAFPLPLPTKWSGAAWMRSRDNWESALGNTVVLGIASTSMALMLAIAWLEGEDQAGGRRPSGLLAAIYLPLLVPQVAFLFGLQIVFLKAGVNGSTAAVIWAQALFVFPYVMMALSDPWRALDRRYLRSAAALGSPPFRTLVKVKLPILLRPILAATAIGFAVSAAQYLPTLIIGEGRVVTLTTEAVALSSGANRRVVGVHAVLQTALPFVVYLAAFLLPMLVFSNRKGISEGFA